jgi:hypothetical protein
MQSRDPPLAAGTGQSARGVVAAYCSGLEERGIPAARGGKWSAVHYSRVGRVGLAARRWRALTSAESCTDRTRIRSSAHLHRDSKTSWPSESSVAMLPTRTNVQSTRLRAAKCIDHTLRVLPFVEARHLHNERQIVGCAIVRQPVGDLLFR